MKSLKHLFLLTTFVLSPVTFAKCVVSNQVATPPFNLNASSTRVAIIHLSNISDQDITVSMTHYDSNGVAFPSSAADTVYGLSGLPTQSGGITMPAKTSGYVYMRGNGSHRIGFAEIKWETKNNTCLSEAMTAMIEHQHLPNQAMSDMAVNGGQAF